MSTLRRADAAPDIDTLKAYTRAKQAIAEEIRILQRIFKDRGKEQDASSCQELMVKLAEDRFTLAVVGQFKRGKSSLMNAILGRDLLPTGILPLTSAITILQYGPKATLVIERERALFAEEAPVERLADYVTEKGNPGNRKGVKAVRLQIPSPFLRQGLEFVDTPGVGSAIEANTATAYGFLPQCDAVLFVTGVDGPLTNAEVDFLARVRMHVRKIFFVVNKTDLLEAQERDAVLEFVGRTLSEHVDIERVSIFPVSSRLGLEAKTAGDAEGYTKSGVKALEEALAAYLSGEKSATFLVGILDKALHLVAEARLKDRVDQKSGSTEGSASRMETLRERLQDGNLLDLCRRPSLSAPNVSARSLPTSKIASDGDPLPDVGGDLRTRGCPVCQHLRKAMFNFYAKWQYALSVDPEVQEAFAAERGFCPFHTWQLVLVASPQGLSRGYPRLADRTAEELARLSQRPKAAQEDLKILLGTPTTCRACRFQDEVEKRYVGRLAEFASTEDGRARYARSQGVCLRHLSLFLAAVTDEQVAGFLLAEAARHFEAYAEDMRSYATKRDAIRRQLLNRDEEDAYLRTLIHLAGDKSFSGPAGEEA